MFMLIIVLVNSFLFLST